MYTFLVGFHLMPFHFDQIVKQHITLRIQSDQHPTDDCTNASNDRQRAPDTQHTIIFLRLTVLNKQITV